ncbi:Spo0B domain-containing protein [Oceanobacillus damuensis]|uniref:Spo0B domain-containing protein n=1 Tax=Oceanobacillus damuensis TaxID=937928 RepID=UPI00082A3D57|nr:Spo0B domain-containing protein [Oceanobacillus damuensis]
MSTEIVQMLQHYRHDLMNRLQIVQGYLSMGKAEKAEEKLNEALHYYNEERKLMSLNVPEFMLWILKFNSNFNNFRLNYTIQAVNKNMHLSDSILLGNCIDIMDSCTEELDSQVLYEIDLEIREVSNMPFMDVVFFIKGEVNPISKLENIKKRFVNTEIDIEKSLDGLVFSFSVPCQ